MSIFEPNVKLPHPDRQVDNLHHLERIAAAMKPDPREYEYKGEVRDLQGMTGKCACGHAIRYEFPVVHRVTGNEVVIGSVCIDSSIPWLVAHGAEKLAESLRAALEANEDAKKEAMKQLRDARNFAEVVVLEDFYGSLKNWHRDSRTNYKAKSGYWVPDFLYRAFPTAKAMTTPGRTAASLRSKIVTMALAAIQAEIDFPTLPEDPKLREKLLKEIEALGKAAVARLERAEKYGESDSYKEKLKVQIEALRVAYKRVRDAGKATP